MTEAVRPSDSMDEGLCVQHAATLVELLQEDVSVEALVAAHINKRSNKEIPSSGNLLELQEKVDAAKTLEWSTVTGRNATRLVLGTEAEKVRKHFGSRIMGSRFVNTWKVEEDSPPRVKARWCLQVHLDPDLSIKAESGDLQSPTLSQIGRAALFQIIASHRWQLMLGDIKGAFLSSGDLPASSRRHLWSSRKVGFQKTH